MDLKPKYLTNHISEILEDTMEFLKKMLWVTNIIHGVVIY